MRAVAIKKGQTREKVAGFREMGFRQGEAYALWALGRVRQSTGEYTTAALLQEQALATTRYLGAPDQAAGMAAYSLACAQAQAGMIGEAVKTLTEAITLNPDVRANASRDADLAQLRDNGQLTAILAV